MCKVDVNQVTNKRTAYCQCMIEVNGEMRKHGKTLRVGEGIFFQKSKTDYGFFCPSCFANIQYSNNKEAKKQDSNELKKHCKHGFIVGTEIEENRKDMRWSLILLRSHFIKSLDCSVENEYISPMMPNLNGLAKLLRNLLNQGFVQDYACGCHVNLSNEIYDLSRFKDAIVNHYEEIFKPLYYAMKYNPIDMKRCFGRELNDYCNKLNPTNKYSFINVKKLENGVLEFRFPKLIDSKQYLATIMFCRKIYQSLYDNLINNIAYETIADTLLNIYIDEIQSR